MNINGPSLRIPSSVPEDITPQRPLEGGGAAPPLAPSDPFLGELSQIRDSQSTVQSLIMDMNAMRANLMSELELLANRQGLPPQKLDAMKTRMDQQLTFAFDQTITRLQAMTHHETLSKQAMSAAIAQFVDAVSTMASNLDAMRGSNTSSGRLA